VEITDWTLQESSFEAMTSMLMSVTQKYVSYDDAHPLKTMLLVCVRVNLYITSPAGFPKWFACPTVDPVTVTPQPIEPTPELGDAEGDADGIVTTEDDGDKDGIGTIEDDDGDGEGDVGAEFGEDDGDGDGDGDNDDDAWQVRVTPYVPVAVEYPSTTKM
jgi:hypothetical protein